MTTDLYGIDELICPVCGKMLTSDEYEHAIEEISLRLGEEYQQQLKKDRSEFEEQIQNERKIFQEKMENINLNHNNQIDMLRNQLAASYNQQVKDIKKSYEDLDLQRQKNSKVASEYKIEEYKQKMIQLNTQILILQQESQEIKENALNDARAALQKDLHSKDIEIRERDEQILR